MSHHGQTVSKVKDICASYVMTVSPVSSNFRRSLGAAVHESEIWREQVFNSRGRDTSTWYVYCRQDQLVINPDMAKNPVVVNWVVLALFPAQAQPRGADLMGNCDGRVAV